MENSRMTLATVLSTSCTQKPSQPKRRHALAALRKFCRATSPTSGKLSGSSPPACCDGCAAAGAAAARTGRSACRERGPRVSGLQTPCSACRRRATDHTSYLPGNVAAVAISAASAIYVAATTRLQDVGKARCGPRRARSSLSVTYAASQTLGAKRRCKQEKCARWRNGGRKNGSAPVQNTIQVYNNAHYTDYIVMSWDRGVDVPRMSERWGSPFRTCSLSSISLHACVLSH